MSTRTIEDVGAGRAAGDAATSDLLRAAFRRHATGVAIVTAVGDDGPVGLTASSVASVSTDPPALSFSVANASRTALGVVEAAYVDVHLLPASRASLADDFGRTNGARFTHEQGWQETDHGLVLPDAVATLRCTMLATVPVGEATVVVAEVVGVHLGPAAAPLVYHDRTYRTVGEVVARA